MIESSAAFPVSQGLSPPPLTEAETLHIQKALYTLLARQTMAYTSGESSSVPLETAEELLSSLCYCLGTAPDGDSAQWRPLLGRDLDEALAAGLRRTRQKITYGRALWQAVCAHLPIVENRSMLETLKSIGTFWNQYDPRFFAHQVPCDVDYQLSVPLPDTLLGISYVNAYLERLAAENRFLSRFSKSAMVPILDAYCPDYRGLLINLFDPIAANALGRVLLGRDVGDLELSPADRVCLRKQFSGKCTQEIQASLAAAADVLTETLGFSGGRVRSHVAAYSKGLAPRIRTAAEAGGLEGIFLSGIVR